MEAEAAVAVEVAAQDVAAAAAAVAQILAAEGPAPVTGAPDLVTAPAVIDLVAAGRVPDQEVQAVAVM